MPTSIKQKKFLVSKSVERRLTIGKKLKRCRDANIAGRTGTVILEGPEQTLVKWDKLDRAHPQFEVNEHIIIED